MMASIVKYAIAVVLDGDTQIACVSRRAPRTLQIRFEMDDVLLKAGFEVRHLDSRVRWPLTALIYRSPSKEGVGRAGSSLYRVACRKVSTDA